jgi:GDPmannose 4,6-dehydratase
MRTALITGVAGQDGGLLAELLLSKGYRVVGVVRAERLHQQDREPSGVKLVTVDLTDRKSVLSLLDQEQPHEVYHLAAFHHSSQDNRLSTVLANKEAMLSTNFLATRTLAFALLEMGIECHLVFASSSQMFTPTRMAHEISEASSRSPSTFYGHVKSWSTDLLAHLRAEAGLRASTAILFNHESPRRSPQFVSRKITQAAARAAAGGVAALELNNIGARVDWSSARDAVRALSLMGRSDAPRDLVVASGRLHSIRDLLDAAFRRVGLDWSRYVEYRADSEAPALVGRPEAIEQILGWQRAVSFEGMVAEMVDADLLQTGRSSV